jgi:AcrR family transcriptional regulator
MTPDRRTRKRLATRQSISDAATLLFFERGFDNVTVDEIAMAADVGRMTVFNYFPRKEDMLFDLDEEGREDVRDALRKRPGNVAPIEALRLFAHRAFKEQRPYVRFFEGGGKFFETVAASETLKARARAIRDELAQVVAEALAESAGRDDSDADARLAAGLLLATWTTAFIQAHLVFRKSADVKKANAAFLKIVDQGTLGVKAAMASTPYA